MTIDQAKRIYKTMGATYQYYRASEWEKNRDELEEVIAAKSDRAAAKIIDYWECWSISPDAPIDCAKLIRKEWKKITSEPGWNDYEVKGGVIRESEESILKRTTKP